MYQVVMTSDGRNTVVYVGTEKAAQRRAAKLRAAETDMSVGYSVVLGAIRFSEPKTSQITSHK